MQLQVVCVDKDVLEHKFSSAATRQRCKHLFSWQVSI